MREPEYYIMEASALPQVFRKVAEAKRLLQTGEAGTVNEAVRMAGISRNAFYKYRDSVSPFHRMDKDRIVTLQSVLLDSPGVLSAILSIFANNGANILTINQSIPSDGCAAVTISIESSGMSAGLDGVLSAARALKGVLKLEVLAG